MIMSKYKLALFLFIYSILVSVLFQCTSPNQYAGGSSGTEVSSVSGIIVDPDGKPLQNAVARLRPADFLSDSSSSSNYMLTHSVFDTITGNDGAFTFNGVMPDSYYIEISYEDSLSVLIVLQKTDNRTPIRLPLDTALPMATITGNLKVVESTPSWSFVQIYGIERKALPDTNGNFSIKIPYGRHRLHINAGENSGPGTKEFDGMDLMLDVGFGEQRNIGSYHLSHPLSLSPCSDYSCDSLAVRTLLDHLGLSETPIDSVCKVRNGRIVELSLRGRAIFAILPRYISQLTELTLLDLGHTGIDRLFFEIGKLTRLETLRLDGNQLTFIPTDIQSLQSLKELNLSGNELVSLPSSIVTLHPDSLLDLSANRLCSLDSVTAAWADSLDSDWKTTQRCQ